MIKKTTIAIFRNGDYAGEYDWQGGIPLTVGELITVKTKSAELTYKLVDKTTNLEVGSSEQIVTTTYWFELV